jgi:hypothetical protein
MRFQPFLIAALLFASTSYVAAQTPDPSGRWEGSIEAPERQVAIAIDLAKSGTGEFTATFSGTDVTGLPLSNVAVNGTSVSFLLKANGGGTFTGSVSADGQSMSGNFTTSEGGFTVPFTLNRTGAARIETLKSARIGTELEGTWSGTLQVNGVALHVAIKLGNLPDGTSAGSIAVAEQGGLEIPVTTITQNAASVKLEVNIVGGVYAGALNPDGTELTGTWSQKGLSAPLNLKHEQK